MVSTAPTPLSSAISTRRQHWRTPRVPNHCRDRSASTRGASHCNRNVAYEAEGWFGCDLIAEAPIDYGGGLAARARRLDDELLQLVRNDSTARRVLGRLAGRFIERRGWERLGFARLGDYTGERLGWSGRQIQEVARVAGALAQLPLIENSFRRGILSWSKARLLAGIASTSDQTRWLAVAATIEVRALTAVTSSARAAAREQRRMAATPFAFENRPDSQVDSSGRAAAGDCGCNDDTRAETSAREAPATPIAPGILDDEHHEERVLVRIPCSSRVRRMWNDARRYAPRMAGRTLAQWEVAELIAAEASSAPGPFQDLWQQEPWRSLASTPTHIEERLAKQNSAMTADGLHPQTGTTSSESVNAHLSDRHPQEPNGFDEPPSAIELELARLEVLDAFELDAAMRRVRCAMQQRQSQLGDSLGLFLEIRLHKQFGYACGADYVRERLGIPDRTARELVRVAQAAKGRSPELASAYARGELSWLKTLTLLCVVKPSNTAAWIERAGEVTLRRLSDEVAWAADRADLEPRFSTAMPPAPGQDLGLGNDDRQMCACGRLASEALHNFGGDDRQMCAHCRLADHTTDVPRDESWGVAGRIHVTFVAPLSVSVLFRTIMQGFASPTEPRWKALERMLEHVLGQWRNQPRHRDPVFARDGYRCTTPGCSSFTNLHDHHIVPRSAGGTNDLGNRTTLCAWHHLRAVHGGLARATGQAPDAIDWELGLADGKPPLMRLRGERYRRGGERYRREQTGRRDDASAHNAASIDPEG